MIGLSVMVNAQCYQPSILIYKMEICSYWQGAVIVPSWNPGLLIAVRHGRHWPNFLPNNNSGTDAVTLKMEGNSWFTIMYCRR